MSPDPGERVEILVDGKWTPATFIRGDNKVGDIDDWWRDHFVLDDRLTTYPDNVQSKSPLPPWRPIDATS